tara:strand:- start:1062 stop:2927 length:1866 start_codon:yes stop_codon:yes gene_type:complete
MIQFENISKSFPSGSLFKNVNLTIKRGIRVGLVGKNGSGKTTLLKMMLGKESPDSGNIKKEKDLTIGYLQQEIVIGTERSIIEEVMASFPGAYDLEKKIISLTEKISNSPTNIDLANQLGEAQHEFDSIGGWSLEKNAKKILGGLGFSESQFLEPMEKFSGGWRMRVALASILLQKPDVLFLDEPTNHLDLDATIWLEKFLVQWKGGMVLISHDRTFLDRSINHIVEIDLNKVRIYHANYSDFIEIKKLEMEQHSSAYKNQQKEIKNTERFIERFRYKNTKSTQVQSRVKKLEKLELIEAPYEDRSIIKVKIPQPNRSPLKLVKCTKVDKNYDNVNVFKELDFVVERNKKIGLVGINGAGKSTLLKMLAGVERSTSGNIDFHPNIDVGYYAQHQLEILDVKDTVFESIRKFSMSMNENEIRTYLGGFMFTGEDIEKKVGVLSGGEKARLALGRMLLTPSNLLLLDEPTNHLDMISRGVVEEVMSSFEGSIVCISHDRHFLNKITNTTCEVSNGGVVTYEGNYEYYEWRKNSRQSDEVKSDISPKKNNKIQHSIRKKARNRASWINKRFTKLENKIDQYEMIINDPKNQSKADLLQEAIDKLSQFENEYLNLVNELDQLNID